MILLSPNYSRISSKMSVDFGEEVKIKTESTNFAAVEGNSCSIERSRNRFLYGFSVHHQHPTCRTLTEVANFTLH